MKKGLGFLKLALFRGGKDVLLKYRLATLGTIAAAFAVMAPVLVGSVGVALDLGQSYHIRARLCGALDVATISGAATYVEEDDVVERVEQFININYPSGAIGKVLSVDVEAAGEDVVARATARYKTSFMRVLGVPEMNISCKTVVHRDVRGLEVALVLDVTGSMQGQSIKSLRTATNNFIEILYDRSSDPDFVKIGLVPYSVAVNVGEIAPSIIDDLPQYRGADVEYHYVDDEDDLDADVHWHGCVMARDYPHDTYDDDMDEGGAWEPYWAPATPADGDDNDWDVDSGGSLNVGQSQCNNRRTPNLGCPEFNPIVPLTTNKEYLLKSAANLQYWCRGGTLGNVGMSWGYRLLSPAEPFTEGASYDNERWQKVVVMMTDGENQFWKKPETDGYKDSDFSPYGYYLDGTGPLGDPQSPLGDNKNEGKQIVQDRFVETCEDMKANGIKVYTIVFGTKLSGDIKDDFESCASKPSNYFYAPEQDDLIEAFERISKELSIIYVSG